MRECQLCIGGSFAGGERMFSSVNPFSEEALALCTRAEAVGARQAVAARTARMRGRCALRVREPSGSASGTC